MNALDFASPNTAVALIALIFVLAGAIKGTFGIGLPTVAVGTMTQFIPPHTAIAIVVFPIVVSNFWQVIRSGAGWATLRKYRLLTITLVIALFATTFFTAAASPEALFGAIGLAVVIFALSNLFGDPPALPDRMDRPGQAVTGVLAGALGGFTSIWAPPLVTYLIARRAPPDEFVRAAGLFIFIGAIPLTLGFWQSGLLNGETARVSALMIIPTLIGFSLGEVLRRRISPDTFRTALLWMFLLMGLNLLRRAFF